MNMGDPNQEQFAAIHAAALSDHAESELKQRPFFSTPELTQRLDLLRHLTDNSERIVILKGPAGSGKSTFLNQFKIQARPEWHLCAIQADPMLQPDQLFTLLFRAYGLSDSNVGDIEHLIDRFSLIQGEDGVAVIAVDDAHLLPVATIIALLRLYERRPSERALARIILFCTAEISDQLRTPQIQAMNLQSIQELEMPRFSVGQCGQFIDHLLDGTSSGEKTQDIAGGVVKRICNAGDGWPGHIESQLMDMVQSGSQSKVPHTGFSVKSVIEDLPQSVLIGVPVLGVILLLTLVFQNQINEYFEAPEQVATIQVSSNPAQPVVPLKLPDAPVKERDASKSIGQFSAKKPEPEAGVKIGDMPVIEPPTVSAGMNMEPEPLAIPINTSPKKVEILMRANSEASDDAMVNPPADVESEPSSLKQLKLPNVVSMPNTDSTSLAAEQSSKGEDEQGSKVIVGAVAPKVAQPEIEPPILDRPKLQDVISKRIAGSPAKVVTPIPSNSVALSKKTVQEIPRTRTSEPKLPPVKEKSVKLAKISKPIPAPVKEAGLKGREWFNRQKPTRYTLQLLGVQEELAAKQFIRRHGIATEAAYFKTLRNGKPWYSVVYGVYSGRDAAVEAKKALPAALKSGAGWPRSFGSIQQVITR